MIEWLFYNPVAFGLITFVLMCIDWGLTILQENERKEHYFKHYQSYPVNTIEGSPSFQRAVSRRRLISPKQVVILVNRRTASSGEAFVFDAKQSKKVKVLGTPTYGNLDYGSASFFNFGCNNYKLMMPTWRSMRLPEYPIDKIGIQPDIYLDKSVKDWIRFAVNYLENK